MSFLALKANKTRITSGSGPTRLALKANRHRADLQVCAGPLDSSQPHPTAPGNHQVEGGGVRPGQPDDAGDPAGVAYTHTEVGAR